MPANIPHKTTPIRTANTLTSEIEELSLSLSLLRLSFFPFHFHANEQFIQFSLIVTNVERKNRKKETKKYTVREKLEPVFFVCLFVCFVFGLKGERFY